MLGLVNYSSTPHSVELRDVPEPEIGEEDVLLAVRAVGVCGSDLHQYHGSQSWKVNYPCVLGHEFGGVIAKVGRRVTAFKEGERAVSETAAVLPANSPYVKSGLYNLDPNRLGFGYGVNGAMTRFAKVPERCLHRIPEGLSFEKAALTEPCCVAYNAVVNNAHIRPGDSVAVIGPGPIGLLCAVMAKLCGANPLIVIGTPADKKRLEVAKVLGATHTYDGKSDDVCAAVKGLGDGFGVDVVIDCAGVSATLKLALELVRPNGQISKVGWGPQPCNFSLDMLVQKAVQLKGSFSHNWPMWEKVLWMMSSGQLDMTHILSRVAPLTQWKSCFDGMQAGELVKAVLVPE
jgi:alcohol dehydrogenase/L-iditol 2-dehydrogenase